MIKQIAVLEQQIKLQKMQILELQEKEQMQKDLYDAMVSAIDDNGSSRTSQNQVQLAQRIYETNITDLKQKHEQNLEETVRHFTTKWENLYAYIKDAERLLDDMDAKRKKERRELQQTHQQELIQIHESYKSQIKKMKQGFEANANFVSCHCNI